MGKNKKLRLKTDYEDLEHKKWQEKNCRRTNYSKKRKNTDYISYKSSAQEAGVYSTKSNQRKNMELHNVFNATRNVDEHSRSKSKGYTAHHPLMKFVTYKKNV